MTCLFGCLDFEGSNPYLHFILRCSTQLRCVSTIIAEPTLLMVTRLTNSYVISILSDMCHVWIVCPIVFTILYLCLQKLDCVLSMTGFCSFETWELQVEFSKENHGVLFLPISLLLYIFLSVESCDLARCFQGEHLFQTCRLVFSFCAGLWAGCLLGIERAVLGLINRQLRWRCVLTVS